MHSNNTLNDDISNMEQSHLCKENSCSSSQEILRDLMKSKVHYHVHKKPITDPYQVLTLLFVWDPFYYYSLPNDLFPSSFQPKCYMHFLSFQCYLILHHSITLTFGDKQKLWSSLLCKFFHYPVIPPTYAQKFSSRPHFSNSCNIFSSLQKRDPLSQLHINSFISLYTTT